MPLKKYAFPLKILDDLGHALHQRLANDAELDAALAGQEGEETSPSEHLHALTLAEQDRFQKMTYTEALERVRNKNPKLMRLYASESAGCLRVY